MENNNPNPEQQKDLPAYSPVGGTPPESQVVTPTSSEAPAAPAPQYAPQPVPQVWSAAPQPPEPQPAQSAVPAEDPDHSYLLAVAFSYFFGSLGVDRFYLGYTGTGIVKLLTFGGFGIWHLIDMILIAFGKKQAKGSQQQLQGYTQHHKAIRMVAVILLVVNALVIVGVVILIALSTFSAVGQQDRARQDFLNNTQNQRLQTQQNSSGSSSYYTN